MNKMNNNNYKKTPKKKEYYMYGTHAVISASKNKNRKIHKIYCLSKQYDNIKKHITHIKVEIITNDFITKKIGHGHAHQGVIALVDTIFKNSIEELDFASKIDRIVILDQISDPQNIGAIIRSAAAFGINKLILTEDNSPDENASIAKTACGCLELVEVAKVTNLKNTITKLKKQGFWISGLDARGKNNIGEISKIDKIAIIIGSEDKGMRKLTSENCDFLVKIPISKNVESLNASNAGSIMFYLLQNNS